MHTKLYIVVFHPFCDTTTTRREFVTAATIEAAARIFRHACPKHDVVYVAPHAKR
jgi:hypothetical protein